ncbi:hypothetical protein D3C74_404500 [compost metagenome]
MARDIHISLSFRRGDHRMGPLQHKGYPVLPGISQRQADPVPLHLSRRYSGQPGHFPRMRRQDHRMAAACPGAVMAVRENIQRIGIDNKRSSDTFPQHPQPFLIALKPSKPRPYSSDISALA